SSPYARTKLVVHLALADFANDSSECWPSQETLAVKCRTTSRWVREVLNEMQRDGWLKKLRRGSNFSGSSRYRLLFPETQPEESSGKPTGSLQSDNRKSVVEQPEDRSATTGTGVPP